MSRNIPDKEMKALIAHSGGVCAYPGCNKRLLEPGNASDEAAFLGKIAHIVADSRQGPRGNSPMSDEDRDKHSRESWRRRSCPFVRFAVKWSRR